MMKHFLKPGMMAALTVGLSLSISGALSAQENSAPVQMPESCSMMMTVTDTTSGEVQMKGQMHKLGDKQRVDIQEGGAMGAMAGGSGMYVINDLKTGTSHMVMPGQKMIMTMDLSQIGLGPGNLKDLMNRTQHMNYEKLGEETLNGTKVTKYQVTDPENNTELTMWVDEKQNFPLRVLADTMQVDYADVKFQAPDAALFEIPEGYTALNLNPQMLEGLMKNMPQGAGAGQ